MHFSMTSRQLGPLQAKTNMPNESAALILMSILTSSYGILVFTSIISIISVHLLTELTSIKIIKTKSQEPSPQTLTNHKYMHSFGNKHSSWHQLLKTKLLFLKVLHSINKVILIFTNLKWPKAKLLLLYFPKVMFVYKWDRNGTMWNPTFAEGTISSFCI